MAEAQKMRKAELMNRRVGSEASLYPLLCALVQAEKKATCVQAWPGDVDESTFGITPEGQRSQRLTSLSLPRRCLQCEWIETMDGHGILVDFF